MIDGKKFIRKISEKRYPRWLKSLRLKDWKRFEKNPSSLEVPEKLKVNPISLKLKSKEKPKENVIFTDVNNAVRNRLFRFYYLSTFQKQGGAFSLSNALWTNGYFLYVPASARLNLNASFSLKDNGFTHNVIVLEEKARVNLIEGYKSKTNKKVIHSGVTEIILKKNASLKLASIQYFGKKVDDYSYKIMESEKNSKFKQIFGYFGGRKSKLEMLTKLKGVDSKSAIHGVVLGSDNQEFEIKPEVHHHVKSQSNVSITGALKGNSKLDCFGTVNIRKKAKNSISDFSSHILHLEKNVSSKSVPNMIIDGNEVKASHKTTVRKINENELFYLMSRGLDQKKAELLIAEGFFNPFIDNFRNHTVERGCRKLIRRRVYV